MSYKEYNDLFEKAQKKNTEYIAFVFDIKNSREYSNETRYDVQVKTFQTINLVTEKIRTIENMTCKKILIDEPKMKVLNDVTKNKDLSVLTNPIFTNGDSFAFFCYNNKALSKNMFKLIFKNCAKSINNNYPYHFASAKFETLDYAEGAKKYYVGYVIEQLTKTTTKQNNDEIISNL